MGAIIKCISWNVNGLRACMNKGFTDFFNESDADFFCLQETKLSHGQVDFAPEGFHCYWNYAERKGYSGTAVFTKHKPIDAAYGMDIPRHDGEGRLITLEYENFYFLTVYTPNSQNGLKRLDYRMDWEDAFREYVISLDRDKPVILCGDLNVAHREIDLKNPKTNRNNAGFTDQERGKISVLLNSGLADTFRCLYPDMTGAYSWWSYRFNARHNNSGWRIDYFLASERLRDRILKAEIYSGVMGSDHCPVGLELDICPQGN